MISKRWGFEPGSQNTFTTPSLSDEGFGHSRNSARKFAGTDGLATVVVVGAAVVVGGRVVVGARVVVAEAAFGVAFSEGLQALHKVPLLARTLML